MTDDECPRRLYVCDIPKGYGLFPLKLKIGETLGDKDALQTIEFVRGKDGTRVEGASEILLKNNQCVKLLKDSGLKIKHRGKFIDLNITDNLPGSKTERAPTADIQESNEGPSQPRPMQRKFSKDRPIPAPRTSTSSYQEDEIQRLQRRIECRNVPLHMFQRKDMFDHFNQYGNIEDLFLPKYLERNRTPFVKVRYKDHESARHALLEGGDLPAFGHKMYITWDSTEAGQVRHRLGMELNDNRGQVRDRTKKEQANNRGQVRDSIREEQANNRGQVRGRIREEQANNRGQVRDRIREEQANSHGRGRDRPSTSYEPLHTHEKAIATTERSSMPKRKEQPTRSRATSSSSTSSERQSRDRNISSPTKRQSKASRGQGDKKIYDWFDILQENSELFQEDAGNRCVLLQTNRVDKADEVKEYFQENHSVNIEHTYPMPDGILLVFDSEDGADEAVTAKSINIDEEKINIAAKTVPGMFRDRFLLEGTFDDHDGVEALLDCCYEEDDASYDVIELESSAFLVKFSDEVDINNILQEIESTELDDYNPKAYAMCRSDCVKVENLPKNVKNDALKLAFQNRKNCGGKVTKVDRNGANTSAIVYFADCEDAEKVYEKVSKDGLQIKNEPVEVSLYFRNIIEAEDKSDDSDESDESANSVDFEEPKPKANKSRRTSEQTNKSRQKVHGAGDNPQKKERARKSQNPKDSRDTAESSKGKSAPKTTKSAQRKRTVVKEFRVTPQVDGDVIKYVRKSKKGFDKLHDDLEALCELEVVERMNDVSFCFRPSIEELDEDIKYNQEEFEERCTLIMDEFFKEFSTKSATYDATNLMNLRTTMNWNEDHEYMRIDVEKEKGVDVYIRWSAKNQGQVVVTGIDDEVADVLQYIKRKCDVTEQSMKLPTNNFRALRECNVIKRIDQEVQHDVEIKAEESGDKQGLIKFKGPRSNVEEAKTKMTNGMMELTTRTLPKMGSRSEYLLTSLKSEVDGLQPGAVDVRQIIQSQFDTDHIYASLQLNNDEVCIKYCDASELEKAQTALVEIVEQKTIPVKEGFQEVISTPEWKRLKQNACSSGAVQVYVNVPKSSIDVVGLLQAFRKAYNDVSKYISENVVVTKSFSGSSYVIKYLQDYLKSHKDSSKKLKEVRLDFKPDESVVLVKGKIRYAMDVQFWLEEVASELTIVEKSIQNPGMPGYFRGRRGREQIETIATKNHCIGVIDSQDEQTFSASPSSPGTKATVTIPDSNVKISLVVSDITTVKYDAIVNASNTELELRPGGVSGAILKKGGHGIQVEMVLAKLKLGGRMLAGQAVSTGSGNLHFKRIIHTVGPTWQQGTSASCQRDLRNCVRNCLREATDQNLQSIAIPAISCGIFGGKASVCAPIIVKAIVDFVTYNEESSLQQVALVEMSNNETVREFEKSLKTVNSNQNISLEDFVNLQQLPREKQTTPRNRARGRQLQLNVTVGDISTFQADVIVTSTNPENLVNCQGSSISKALLKQAGNALKKACHQASHKHLKLGDVVPTPGFNLSCQEVYHVMFGNYNPYNGEEFLQEAIKSCLDKADNSGYSSIAFPALGAGGFQYPSQEVVKVFDEIVRNYEASKLTNVHLVIYSGDASTISAAQTELSVNISQVPTSNPAPATFSRTTIQVIVKQGDITTTSSPAIVNSTSQFDLSGQVGKALVAKAGVGIVQECANNPISQTNNMRVTSGGNLCQYILHLATPKNPNQLENVLIDCFTEADRLGVNSLAVPPVGTGGIGLPSPVVAKTLAAAIDKFDKTNPVNLKKIKVFVFKGNMLPDFQQELLNQPSQSLVGKMFSSVSSAFGFGGTGKPKSQPKPPSILPQKGSSSNRDHVRILFCSWKKQEVDKAFSAFQEIIDEMSIEKVIKNNAVADLTLEEERHLLSLAQKEGVLIEKTSRTELTLKGLGPKVLEAYGQANDIIHQFKQALLISEHVMWKYQDQNDSQMKEFSLHANMLLEDTHKKNDKGKTNVQMVEGGVSLNFSVDFSKMEARTGSVVCKVERNVLSSSVDTPIPPSWDDMGGQMCKRVVVPTNTAEYQTTLQKFQIGVNVISLERIQNPTLWNQFQAQKRKIENKMLNQQVTRELFHGSDKVTCDKILKDGFDRSYAGKHAAAHGRGVYFATTANYSHGYSTPDAQQRRSMFLAEVITGTYCVGTSRTTVAPMQQDGSPFDSVVNVQQNPTIFVVFRDSSVYPTYLLTFT